MVHKVTGFKNNYFSCLYLSIDGYLNSFHFIALMMPCFNGEAETGGLMVQKNLNRNPVFTISMMTSWILPKLSMRQINVTFIGSNKRINKINNYIQKHEKQFK